MKKILLFTICFLGIASQAHAAVAFTQSTSTDAGTVTSKALAFTSNVGASSFIVVCVREGSGNNGNITVTDSLSNTYTKIASTSEAATGVINMFTASNASAGADSVTVTLPASLSLRMAIHEFSGVSAFDASSTAIGTSANANGGSITATNGDLLMGCGAVSATKSFTPVGFTLRENIPASTNGKLGTGSTVATTTATWSAPFTLSGSDTWIGITAGFTASPSTVTVSFPTLTITGMCTITGNLTIN